MEQYDLAVIGGGSAGLTAAITAGRLGARALMPDGSPVQLSDYSGNLLLLRYPGALVGVALLFFVRGPAPIRSTRVGKVTTFSTALLLVAATLVLLVRPGWLPVSWVSDALTVLYLLLGINIVYFAVRAIRWQRQDAREPE